MEGDLGDSQGGCDEDLLSDPAADNGSVYADAGPDSYKSVAVHNLAVGHKYRVFFHLQDGMSPFLRRDVSLQIINASNQIGICLEQAVPVRNLGRQSRYVFTLRHAQDGEFLDAAKSVKWLQKVALTW